MTTHNNEEPEKKKELFVQFDIPIPEPKEGENTITVSLDFYSETMSRIFAAGYAQGFEERDRMDSLDPHPDDNFPELDQPENIKNN